MGSDERILELSIKKLSEAFDRFIGECMEDGQAKQPTQSALMKARAYLPPDSTHSFSKKVNSNG